MSSHSVAAAGANVVSGASAAAVAVSASATTVSGPSQLAHARGVAPAGSPARAPPRSQRTAT